MLDAKEQAKYYIEKIRSIGKVTNQTLLIIFIPLAFLWLSEVEKNYAIASLYIDQVEKRADAREKEKKERDLLMEVNKSIGAFYAKIPDSIRSTSREKDTAVHTVIKSFHKDKRNYISTLSRQAKKISSLMILYG